MNQRGDKKYWHLIWEQYRAGDRNAFETIYNEFVDVLYAYGSKITSNKALLEDAVQDVFIDAYTYGKTLRQAEYLEFYLFKALKRNLIKKIQENNRFSKSEEETQFSLKFPIEDMDEEMLQREKQFQLLQKEVEQLDAQKRELLFLKFNSGLTYNEIGKLLDINPDTAKKQVHRLLKHFRKKLVTSFIELFILCYKT